MYPPLKRLRLTSRSFLIQKFIKNARHALFRYACHACLKSNI
ncbi:hypothetical protein [Clostridioides phage phiCD27]|uniref:Uncharacterized protein n=2 Tax=Caudoviricetes TaxID=2731619 RepID=X5JAC9_9CAUD|nr:hypothetical protein phiCD27_gp74 [Clostridioides phage phiCD27]YP_009032224.1 hypothetical protein FG38_gp82 [Clostridium phage CDMH1]ACH91365.1 hypothetical protein [Clostridioides phage phiCD27]CDI66702.1 conserved hypothetical protein [Clostridium phage CDMH1]DAI87183.1 MAG TPA: hypothetical protein [Caudoviricetes sp.]